jgi:hypothetical protein
MPKKEKATTAEEIDLSVFDYKNLTGEDFKNYVEIAGDRSYRIVDRETGEEKPVIGLLREDQMHDYELYRVEVVMRPRYPGVKDTPIDFNGVKTRTEKPDQRTRITVKSALELNAQILNAHSRAGHGRYYLLKK